MAAREIRGLFACSLFLEPVVLLDGYAASICIPPSCWLAVVVRGRLVAMPTRALTGGEFFGSGVLVLHRLVTFDARLLASMEEEARLAPEGNSHFQ
jgi:hypothetical protein